MSDTRYTLTRDGQQYGPYTLSQLRDYIAKGNISEEDLVWATGMSAWTPAGRVVSQAPPARPPAQVRGGAAPAAGPARAIANPVLQPLDVTRPYPADSMSFDRGATTPSGFFSIFSMEGRYNRARYFWTSMGIVVCGYILMFICAFVIGMLLASGGSPDVSGTAGGFVGIVFGVLIQVMCAFPTVKRLHDIGRPGTHYWLLLIPLYNIYLGCLLLFKRGDFGANQYGPDPLAASVRY